MFAKTVNFIFKIVLYLQYYSVFLVRRELTETLNHSAEARFTLTMYHSQLLHQHQINNQLYFHISCCNVNFSLFLLLDLAFLSKFNIAF